jgi:hypothetical protein
MDEMNDYTTPLERQQFALGFAYARDDFARSAQPLAAADRPAAWLHGYRAGWEEAQHTSYRIGAAL